MTAPHRPIRPPRQYFDAIRRSDQYMAERSRLNDSEHDRRAIGATALRFVAEREAESPYLDLDVQAVRIIGLLDDFMTGEHALDLMQDRMRDGERISRDERRAEVKKTVKFNHALRELIDTNQRLTLREIEQFVGAASMELYDSEQEREYLLNKLRMCMVGMQHEVVAEQALWTIDGVEDVIHADVEDELRGIDLKVIYHGRGVNLDIKASQRAADMAAMKAQGHRQSSVIVWTGTTSTHLNGHFRGDDETVATVRGNMQSALDQAVMPQRVAT